MGKDKQAIQTLDNLRKVIREIIMENSLSPDTDLNPDINKNDKPIGPEKTNDEPNQVEKTPDAEKCLSQIQELLNWYFK